MVSQCFNSIILIMKRLIILFAMFFENDEYFLESLPLNVRDQNLMHELEKNKRKKKTKTKRNKTKEIKVRYKKSEKIK